MPDPNTPYNGYTNWATWNMELWMDNDESIYTQRKLLWLHISAPSIPLKAKLICIYFFPHGTPDMKKEELADINWQELGEHWEAEAKEDPDARS